jgi:hypothetical protein
VTKYRYWIQDEWQETVRSRGAGELRSDLDGEEIMKRDRWPKPKLGCHSGGERGRWYKNDIHGWSNERIAKRSWEGMDTAIVCKNFEK